MTILKTLLTGFLLAIAPAVFAQEMADPEPLKKGQVGIIGARFLDLEGRIHRVGDDNGPGAAAFVFVRDSCPISRRYLGELNDFAAYAAQNGVDFYAVYSSPKKTWDDARILRDKYKLDFPVLFDPSGDIAFRLNAKKTPDAFVINGQDEMVYRGRIDDRFAGIGKLRRVIKNHDLRDMLARVNTETVTPYSTPAFGCFFESWERQADRPVTYNRDIKPLLSANCVECHQAGGVAPFALENYEDSAERSSMMEYVTEEGLMPPWRPVKTHGRFRDERYLSQLQIDLFRRWTENDDALGEATDAPPEVVLPDPGWRMGEPDLVLTMSEPFPVPATGDDVYRYFVLPSGMLEDRSLIGIDFLPGNTTVVHHANFFVDYGGKARREDAKDALPGFSVFGTGGFMSYDSSASDNYGIGGWAPGAEPYRLPPNTGIWLAKGGDIVIEVHYKLSGVATTDQSKIGLYFSDKPTKYFMDGLLIGSEDLKIKAGDANYNRHISMDVPAGFTLIDLMPHMHYIGHKAAVTVTFPDGRVHDIVRIEDWDIRWQNIYVLRDPLYVPKGSRIDAWFVYDNSADNFDNPYDPPRDLAWGWKSEDEMAEVWLGVIPDSWDDSGSLAEAAGYSWYSTDGKKIPPLKK